MRVGVWGFGFSVVGVYGLGFRGFYCVGVLGFLGGLRFRGSFGFRVYGLGIGVLGSGFRF